VFFSHFYPPPPPPPPPPSSSTVCRFISLILGNAIRITLSDSDYVMSGWSNAAALGGLVLLVPFIVGASKNEGGKPEGVPITDSCGDRLSLQPASNTP